jgi:rod shape-determining protein MreC
MEFLPLDSDIVEGDVVLTSGLDGIYPKGLTVGTVKQARTAAGGVGLTIEPDVDFRRLEEIMVVVTVAEADTSAAADDITDPAARIEALPTEEAAGADNGEDGSGEADPDPDAQGDA